MLVRALFETSWYLASKLVGLYILSRQNQTFDGGDRAKIAIFYLATVYLGNKLVAS